jgi:hypothetical protein
MLILFFFFSFLTSSSLLAQILQENVLRFVNLVGHVVHSNTEWFEGAPNKNIGDAFLLVWKMTKVAHRRELRMKQFEQQTARQRAQITASAASSRTGEKNDDNDDDDEIGVGSGGQPSGDAPFSKEKATTEVVVNQYSSESHLATLGFDFGNGRRGMIPPQPLEQPGRGGVSGEGSSFSSSFESLSSVEAVAAA